MTSLHPLAPHLRTGLPSGLLSDLQRGFEDAPLRLTAAALADVRMRPQTILTKGRESYQMKILVVDDHALFRAGLRLLLVSMGGNASIYEAATAAEATAVAAAHPDLAVCLLDLSLGPEHGLDSLKRFKAIAPDVVVVIVSAANDMATVRMCIEAGAMSFVPKSMPPETLRMALEKVLTGQIYLPEEVMHTTATVSRPSLSPRQIDVLRGLARALPTKSIARELFLSEYTVKEYISGLFEALQVHNRTEAVITASRLGLLSLSHSG